MDCCDDVRWVRLRHAPHLTVDFFLDRAHLAHAAQHLFASTAAQLVAAGQPPSLAPLSSDHLATLAHRYEASDLSRATHKLTCSLQRMALCGEGLQGGELTLHTGRDDGEYVLLLSDGHLQWHAGTSEVHCDIHLVSPVLHCRRVTRTLDLSRLVRPGELCMIRSRAPLTVKFGRASRCALWTRGTCRLDLHRAAHLALWSESDARHYPMAWLMDSTQLANRRLMLPASPLSEADRALVYHRLFDQQDARCDVALSGGHMSLLTRYDLVSEPPDWQWDPLGLRELRWLRPHGTLDSDYPVERRLMESLCVLYRGDAQWPEFYVRRRDRKKRLLSVQRARYRGRVSDAADDEEDWYYVNALYYSDDRRDKAVVAYFYLNLEENRLLLIPPH